MSRLTEIFDNHSNIDELSALLKHYGVNAQFVAESLAQSFEGRNSESGDEDENENGNGYPELIDDLKQFIARM